MQNEVLEKTRWIEDQARQRRGDGWKEVMGNEIVKETRWLEWMGRHSERKQIQCSHDKRESFLRMKKMVLIQREKLKKWKLPACQKTQTPQRKRRGNESELDALVELHRKWRPMIAHTTTHFGKKAQNRYRVASPCGPVAFCGDRYCGSWIILRVASSITTSSISHCFLSATY